MKNQLKALLLGLVISLLLLELACAVLIRTDYLPARLPSYSMEEYGKLFWVDINEDFGVWHLSDATFRHQKSCFDQVYQSNSYGARDIERPRVSADSRIIVLGDSFVEGYGVARVKRFTERLETLSGVPHLNFGTSGSFGSTQAYLLYHTMAKKFDHDAIIIACLPDNDFKDDAALDTSRYAPHWNGSYPNYELNYTIENINHSSLSPSRVKFKWWREVLRNFTHIKNVADLVEGIISYRRQQKNLGKEIQEGPRSMFVDFSSQEFNRLIFSYEKLLESADDRPVILFTLPRIYDLQHFMKYQDNPLGEKLTAWSRQYPQLTYIDLLPLMSDELTGKDLSPFSIFHSCDGHWNDQGHAMAADIIAKELTASALYTD